MTKYLIILLCFVLSCHAEFADYIQVYEQECLGEDKIHCTDGSCIWHHQYCDGKVDCPDGSDENVCLDHTPEPHLCQETLHFLCTDKKKCIPRAQLCNNQTDCLDNSDEHNCTDTPLPTQVNTTCKGFKCVTDGRCISSFWACDGTYDCSDRSDEDPDTCWHTGRIKQIILDQCPTTSLNIITRRKMYTCQDGTMCLEEFHFCDGLLDCKDGTDEGDFCKDWSTMCTNNTCNDQTAKATCYPDRQGPICICHDSYHAFNKTANTCMPVNMCAEPMPYCSQICKDMHGPFLCDCEPGYLKDGFQVGHVCMAPDPEGMLFFSTKNEIKYLALKTKKIVTVATGIKHAHGVSYDGQYLYWVETAQGHQAIVRAHLENVTGTKQVVVGVGLEDPGDIAFDWLGGHLYFGDAQRGAISACRLDGSLCASIRTQAKLPKFLTLDVRNGKMYWADWHKKPIIMSAAMDGSGSAVLTDSLSMFAAGLAVDAPSHRLYFVDTTLKGMRLDDRKIFTVFSEPIHQPYAVAVFENTIYWSDWASNTIQTSDKLTGGGLGGIAVLDSAVYGLHIYHPILQSATNNPCRNHNCSHFCFLTSNVTHSCGCPDGMEIVNSNVCQQIKGYRPQYLVVGSGASFTRIQYNTLGNPETHIANFDIGRVQAMAYDSLRDALYIYDAQRRSITYVNMNEFSRGITHLMLYRGLENVVDMDYDYITDSLYFLDAGRRFIEAVSLRTGKRALLHRFDSEIPISMCVMPEYGIMWVAVAESEQVTEIHIDSFSLDGSGRQHILMNNLKGPHIRLKYAHNMNNVYLADEGNSVIDYMHPLGTGRENYRELSTTITNLAVTDTLVFWTDRRSSRLYWADIHDTSHNIRRIELSSFPNTTHLHIQATTAPLSIPYHPCQMTPCSDICVQSPKMGLEASISTGHLSSTASKVTGTGYKCLCPPGLLLVDGKCIELVRCQEGEAFCHNSNVCIVKSKVCDGKKDCLHGEDEEDCVYSPVSNTTCSESEMLCEGKCVDRYRGCVPTDTTTPAPDLCRESQFLCSKGSVCIERAQMCDGVTDCPDGSDEAHALCSTLNCLHTEFMCSSGQCILASFRCDGESDCYDDSDELDCVNKTCQQGYYQCRNSECIEIKKRCDRQQDCIDNSDEEECEEPDYFDVKEDVENCAEWEHTCELNRTICLPLTVRCNDKPDCPGNTDELGCMNRCLRGGFRCKQESKCVPLRGICDFVKHCADGSDETPEACEIVNKTSRLYPIRIFPSEECHEGYQCATGQCLEWGSVCDGKPDCYDGSDEGELCESSCVKETCPHACQRSPRGAHCRCPAGYARGAPATCSDVDECRRDACSQRCRNLPGSFVCSCHTGYALRSDRRSCKAVKGTMSILYVTGNSVRSITADGLISTEFNDKTVASISDMDFDVRRKKLYVTSAESGQVIEVNSTQSSVVVSNVGRPTRVAVDWVSGNVYFVDAAPPAHLRVCNVRRKRCARLHKLPPGSHITALIIDPASRRLFYCATRDFESVIWSATLAGKQVTQIAVVQNCTGLAVDTFKKRLYVAETGPSHIVSMDYEGNLFKQVLTDEPQLQAPHDLAIFEDYIYFLVANSFKLSRCLLFGRKHCELYLQRVFNANSFVIRHESVQRDDIVNVCVKFDCDNVCVAGDSEPVCLCDDGTVRKDKCALVAKAELPLFNGWTFQDYQSAHQISLTLIISVAVLFLLYLSAFLYYQFVHKRNRDRAANYGPRVHFQNSMAEGSEGLEGLSPISSPILQMPATESTTHEFVNPLQMFRNWRQSFRRAPRPVGTAGLSIEVPPMDVSDTESDMDDREHKNILKKI